MAQLNIKATSCDSIKVMKCTVYIINILYVMFNVFNWTLIFIYKGIRQFEFPLADEPVKGEWKIVASFQGDITSTVFEVKEYGKMLYYMDDK